MVNSERSKISTARRRSSEEVGKKNKKKKKKIENEKKLNTTKIRIKKKGLRRDKHSF